MKDVWLRGGAPTHPWVYDKRVRRVDAGTAPGAVVRVRTREGRPVGYAFFHPSSLITLRMLSSDPEQFPDEAWLQARIRAADALRTDLLHLPDVTNAWRVVHGEGDGLSGLIVDRYGDVGSVSLYSLGWAKRQEELERVLREEAGFERLVVRVDPKAAVQEGIEVLSLPSMKPVPVEEHDVVYLVDPTGRHKTGFFLDQRENRRFLARLAPGRTVFDGMTHAGGFALAAAKAGAASVRGMDLDEEAVAQARVNAEANEVDVTFDHGDVFDALRSYAADEPQARPEVLVVDPPKWARDRKGLGAALARYRDLNRLALEAVRPGGIVCTNSCSGLVSESEFLQVIRDAALDAKKDVRVLAIAGAAADHPISTRFPEGRYLKCVFLAVDER